MAFQLLFFQYRPVFRRNHTAKVAVFRLALCLFPAYRILPENAFYVNEKREVK